MYSFCNRRGVHNSLTTELGMKLACLYVLYVNNCNKYYIGKSISKEIIFCLEVHRAILLEYFASFKLLVTAIAIIFSKVL